MNSTALGAEKENINFISEAHEKFYYEKIQKVREADVYHKALCYCIGMNEDTRRNVDRIYNFKTGCVKPECLHEGWQTSGSAKVVRMAFNLYCNGTPSVDDEQDTEEQVDDPRRASHHAPRMGSDGRFGLTSSASRNRPDGQCCVF